VADELEAIGVAVGNAVAEWMRDAGVLCEGAEQRERRAGFDWVAEGASAGSGGADGENAMGSGEAAGGGHGVGRATGGGEASGGGQPPGSVDADPSARDPSALAEAAGGGDGTCEREDVHASDGDGHTGGEDVHTGASSLHARSDEATAALYRHRLAEAEALRDVARAFEVGGVAATDAAAALLAGERGRRRAAGGVGAGSEEEEAARHAGDDGERYSRGALEMASDGDSEEISIREGAAMAPAAESPTPASEAGTGTQEKDVGVHSTGEGETHKEPLVQRLELQLSKTAAGDRVGLVVQSGRREMLHHPAFLRAPSPSAPGCAPATGC
jgi:hypothetical protein